MGDILGRIKEKLGEFWLFSIMVFISSRVGDLINAFISLYLLPKYVSPEELGAVLPIGSFAFLLGAPISIAMVAYTKLLNYFLIKEEYGKIKQLLRYVLGFVGVMFVVIVFVSGFVLPLFFKVVRIEKGSLDIVIISSAMLTTVSPIFLYTLQALKKFKTVSLINICAAPLRLVLLLITIPFRAITGYYVAQSGVSFFQICISLFSVRKIIGPDVVREKILDDKLKRWLKGYLFLIMLYYLPGVFSGFYENLVIRQYLPEIDSAAYYMISRFAEISVYLGYSLCFVIFPLASEKFEKGEQTNKLLFQAMGAIFIFGSTIAIVLGLFGEMIFENLSNCERYKTYVPQMVLLTFYMIFVSMVACFQNVETASSRFSSLVYMIPLQLFSTFTLFILIGYKSVVEYLPTYLVGLIERVDAANLDFILWFLTIIGFIRLVAVFAHIHIRSKRKGISPLIKMHIGNP